MTPDQVAAALLCFAPALGDSIGAANLHAPGALGAAAGFYASVGWPAFPLKVGDKRPATLHGLKDATTDPEQIARWWKDMPWANIGLVTGVAFDVLDLDAPLGFESFAALKADSLEAGHPFPRILAVAHTANGGRHFLLPPTGRGNAAGLRPGLDYRGVGGYIVAPPSRLAPDGRSYTWITTPAPELIAA